MKIWNTFDLDISQFVAWFSCLGLSKIGLKWWFFFQEWQIFMKSKQSSYSSASSTGYCLFSWSEWLLIGQFEIAATQLLKFAYRWEERKCSSKPDHEVQFFVVCTSFRWKNGLVPPGLWKNWRNCPEFWQRAMKIICIDSFFSNEQFDGGVFWLSK